LLADYDGLIEASNIKYYWMHEIRETYHQYRGLDIFAIQRFIITISIMI